MNRALRRTSLSAALLALTLATDSASAQIVEGPVEGGDEALAYTALSTTPVGAFAPMAEIPAMWGTAGRMQLHAQLSTQDQGEGASNRNFGLGLTMPTAFGLLRFTAGLIDYVCDDDELFPGGEGFELDCRTGYMGGIDATIPLVRPVLAGGPGSAFSASLVVSFGASTNDVAEISFEDPFDPSFSTSIDVSGTSWSAALGIPLAFIARSGETMVIPHLTPRLGYGSAKVKVDAVFEGEREEFSMSGADLRPMVGAGVDILFGQSGFGLGLGVQKVFAEDSEMLIGLNLSFRPR